MDTIARHIILFIHGFDGREPGTARDRLLSGLVETTTSARITPLDEECRIPGHEGRALQVDTADGRRKTIEVYEAYWGDLIPASREETPLQRLASGFALLVYWLWTPYWRIARERNLYLIISMVASALLLVAWYYGVVALALTALGNPQALPESLQNIDGIETVSAWLGALGTAMGNWKVWAVIVAGLALVPVERLVDMARFTRHYLQNAVLPGHNVGLRDRIRHRLLGCLRAVLDAAEERPVDRVIVVAHSLGTVMAADLLSAPLIPGKIPVHLVSLGPPLRFLAHKSPWLQERLAECLQQGSYATWVDFHSNEDWWCSSIPDFGKNRLEQHGITIDWSASLGDCLSGKTHRRYVVTRRVAELLVDHPGEQLQLPPEQEVIA